MSSISLEEGNPLPASGGSSRNPAEQRFAANRLFHHSADLSLRDRLSLLLASTLGFVLLVALSPILLILGAGMLGARWLQHFR